MSRNPDTDTRDKKDEEIKKLREELKRLRISINTLDSIDTLRVSFPVIIIKSAEL